MNSKTRRFAAALSLTLMLATTPAALAAGRDRGDDRVNNPIVKIVKNVLRFFSVFSTADWPVGPLPNTNPNPQP